MRKLNKSNRNDLAVIAEILNNGSVEWKIAEYINNLGYYDIHKLSDLLDSVKCLSEPVKFRICNHFKDMRKNLCFDDAKITSSKLKKMLKK